MAAIIAHPDVLHTQTHTEMACLKVLTKYIYQFQRVWTPH